MIHPDAATIADLHLADDEVVICTPTCIMCGQGGHIVAKASEVEARRAGAHIQDAFPNHSKAEREQIKMGTHETCWHKLMGPEQ